MRKRAMVSMPWAIWLRLKEQATREGRTISGMIRRCIESYLKMAYND